MKLKHVYLFEEIGFKPSWMPPEEEKKVVKGPPKKKNFLGGLSSMLNMDGEFEKIARQAFLAGRDTTLSFEDWWDLQGTTEQQLDNPPIEGEIVKKIMGYRSE